MSSGLILTGMNHPSKTWSFFNLRRWMNGSADYTLIIMFPAALATHYVLYKTSHKRGRPILEKSFQEPTYKNIDKNLILGAATFGAGWAISGYCPLGAVTAAFSGQPEPIITALSMFLGWCSAHIIKQKQKEPNESVISTISKSISIKKLGAIVGTFALILMLSGKKIIENQKSPYTFCYTPIIGGMLLGCSMGAAFCLTGQILGTSGMLSGIVVRDNGTKSRNIAVLFGIGLGTVLFRLINPTMNLSFFNDTPIWRFCLGGFLTGIGTGLSNGCTSGHGVCGVSRMAPRSLVATGIFMATSLIISTIFNF